MHTKTTSSSLPQLDPNDLRSLGPIDRRSPSGIGGWLLLFCVSLTIILPMFGGSTLLKLYQAHQIYQSDAFIRHIYSSPFYKTIFWVSFATSVGIIVGSFYCGVLLFQKRPSAVRITKAFLIYLLFHNLLTAAFTFFGPPSLRALSRGDRVGGLFIGVLGSISSFGLWYTYFSRSVRVKNTFSNPEDMSSVKAS